MKKFTAIILSFVFILLITGCKDTQTTGENIINGKDLTWWEENYEIYPANASLILGINHTSKIEPKEVLELYKKIEPAGEVITTQLSGSYFDYAYGIDMYPSDGTDHFLTAYFICDFDYVVLYPDGENAPHVYWLGNSDEIKQFFIDKDVYIAPDLWEDMLVFIEDYLKNTPAEEINSTALSGIYNQPKPEIPGDFVLEYTYNTSVNKLNSILSDGNTYEIYTSAVYAAADDLNSEKSYIIRLEVTAEEENLAVIRQYIHEVPVYKPDSYTLAGMDYTLWRDKIGNSEHNGYRIQSGIRTNSTGSSSWSSAPDFNSDFMKCLDTLQLGEIADVNKADYRFSPVYTIALQKDSRPIDAEKLFTVYFYEDCKYASVCSCEGWTSRGDCNIHPVYTVENPRMVQEIFKKHYKFIPYDVYTEIVDHAEEYITETPEKLLEKNATDIEIRDSANLSPVMNRINISPYKDYENPESDKYYRVEMPLWYFDLENDIHTEYHLNMIVRKTFFGWKTTWVEIYENIPENYMA